MWFEKTIEYVLANKHFVQKKLWKQKTEYLQLNCFRDPTTKITHTIPISTFDIANMLLTVIREKFIISNKQTEHICESINSSKISKIVDEYIWESINSSKISEIVDEDYFRYYLQKIFIRDLEKGIIDMLNLYHENKNSEKLALIKVFFAIMNILKVDYQIDRVIENIKIIVRYN